MLALCHLHPELQLCGLEGKGLPWQQQSSSGQQLESDWHLGSGKLLQQFGLAILRQKRGPG